MTQQNVDEVGLGSRVVKVKPDPLAAAAHATKSTSDDGDKAERLAGDNGNVAVPTKPLALHIDIEVHIDPTSSAEQIDHIFASMAKHFYGIDS